MEPNAATDREAIERLIYGYSYAVDSGDFDAAAEMFEGARWGVPGRFVYESPRQIREFFEHTPLYDGRPRTRHVLTNVTITIDGDTATATSYVQLVRQRPGGPIEIAMSGTYNDAFRRVAGGWRFTHKLSSPELSILQSTRPTPTDPPDA